MENRERDKLSRSDHPTEAGDINRKTSQRKGQENDSSADFGQSIGRSESPLTDVPAGSDSGSERYDSTSGRGDGSSGDMIRPDESESERDDSMNRSDRSSDTSEGRH